MPQTLDEKIALVQTLIQQRIEIDRQLVELMGGAVAGSSRKPNEIPAVRRGRTPAFSEAEQRNIIELYNRGETTGALVRKFGGTPNRMSTYLWNLKKKGLIQDRVKGEMNA